MPVKDVSDLWRLEILSMHGGLYLDTDTIMVKPLHANIRSYEAVASYDWVNWFVPFPDVINNGVMLGKPGAAFWRLFEEGMKQYDPTQILWSNIRMAYKVKERHPVSLKIEPHLQVICFRGGCHPTWLEGYHGEKQTHLSSKVPLDWKNDAFVFHWTGEAPVEFYNETQLFKSQSMFSEIGRYVLNKAGIIH